MKILIRYLEYRSERNDVLLDLRLLGAPRGRWWESLQRLRARRDRWAAVGR